tara:strand:- start:810 stop:1073 length:264 start_codon:yes stop_codon:yes gene_type:complete
MKFNCKKCNKTKDIYKVKFTAVDSDWVCKDARCCDEYMKQVLTDEYEGIPEIKRNEMIHSKPDGDKEWEKLRKHMHEGGLAEENKNE